MRECRLFHVPDRVVELYPNDQVAFPRSDVVSYLGVPMVGSDGRVLGHLAVVDVRPIPHEKRLLTLFGIFANRAMAEMRRVRAEEELRERQEKVTRLVDSAMDAIVEVDAELRITMMNAAAEKVFARAPAPEGNGRDDAAERCHHRLRGRGLDALLGAASTARIRASPGSSIGRRGRSATCGSRTTSWRSRRRGRPSRPRRRSPASSCGGGPSTRSSSGT